MLHPTVDFEAEGISKVFVSGQHPVWALRDVSLRVAPSSFVCIVGPSGCGKSTLLRILGGLDTASSGRVTMPAARGRAPASAFVFQEQGVFPWLNVLDNITFGCRMAGVRRAECTRRAREWIERTGLSGFDKAYPHQLSGGMRQRVALARAFAVDSPALLMDEPLGALDAQTRLLMQEQLIGLWEAERKTVILVTHSIDEALFLGDRIILMSARPGRIKAELAVPFPRPRRLELERTPEFGALRHRIWEALRDEAETSAMTR
ncbi:ABC transporter ATP-binding protein [Nocardia sp. NPDC020380]|uniref:ABC transporter ATP-binding protein n=1 Tax=Nocardia sp. NPDC020380 TaxID=3364309 RepID=UPI0037BD141D